MYVMQAHHKNLAGLNITLSEPIRNNEVILQFRNLARI